MQVFKMCYLKLSMAVLLGTAIVSINGCDNKTIDNPSQAAPASSSQNIPTIDGSQDDAEIVTKPPATTTTAAPSTATVEASSTAATVKTAQAVTPNGFGGVSFGQEINDDLLNELGLVKDENIDNPACYYVHDPKLTYMDDEFGERASVLYQIIDGRVALISIQDPNIPFYTVVKIGDMPKVVLQAHPQVTYAVNKYSTDGNYYELLHNVNFDVTTPPKPGYALKKENYRLNSFAKKYNQTTPLQIKYQFKDGQPLGQTDVAANAWTDANKNKLSGSLYNIDIGEPEAIYLVEGCS